MCRWKLMIIYYLFLTTPCLSLNNICYQLSSCNLYQRSIIKFKDCKKKFVSFIIQHSLIIVLFESLKKIFFSNKIQKRKCVGTIYKKHVHKINHKSLFFSDSPTFVNRYLFPTRPCS
jgi:hypothetical protein